MTRCHLCGSLRTVAIPGSRDLPRVSSACLPLSMRPVLLSCQDCLTLSTAIDDVWLSECSRIYEGYHVYPASDGVEEHVFAGGKASYSRSTRIVQLLQDYHRKSPRSWLDFGCGNGALLKAANDSLPECELFAVEVSEHNREVVQTLANVRECASSLGSLSRHEFDVISLIHVLEHVPNPRSLLIDLHSRLTTDGLLAIQVPSIRSNPYVLSVGDHATHFDLPALTHHVQAAGFECLLAIQDLIPGELTVIAQATTATPRPPSETRRSASPASDATRSTSQHTQVTSDLLNAASWLRSTARDLRSVGIFGTSIAGTWAGSTILMTHEFWVDEDSHRVGRTWLNMLILSPSEVPKGLTTIVPLAPRKAHDVVIRLSAPPFALTLMTPPVFTFSSAEYH